MSVTIIKREESIGGYYCEYVGLATDEKPTKKGQNGSKFTEMDTGKVFLYNEQAKGWIPQGLDKYLAKIEITTPATKTAYVEGEEFDATGMVVQATYTDNSTAQVDAVAPVEPLVGGQPYVIVSYMEDGIMREAQQEVVVYAREVESAEALKAVLAVGGHVTIEANITLAESVNLTNDATIDLGEYEIDGSVADNALFVVDGCTLTLKGEGTLHNAKWIASAYNGGKVVIENGNYESNNEAFKAIGNGSKVQFNDGHVTSQETAISANQGGIIEMNGGLISTIDNMGIATNGSSGQGGNTIIINGGKIDAHITSAGWEACAIYVANNDVVVINGGEFVANDGAGLCMRAGNVTINGGTIISTGEPGTTGKIADGKFQMGKSAVIYHEKANYPGKEGMELTINGGTFIGVDHSVEVLSNEETPNVHVVGGEFTPSYPEEVA